MYNLVLAAVTESQFRILGLCATGILALLTLIVTLAVYLRVRKRESKEQTSTDVNQPAEDQVAESTRKNVAEEQPEEPQLQPVQNIVPQSAQTAVEKTEEASRPAQDDQYPQFIKGYLQKLNDTAKHDFITVVLNNSQNLTTRIILPVNEYGENEEAFINDYFNSCTKFAKYVPTAIPVLLYERLSALNYPDADIARARRKLISVCYLRRGEESAAFKCEELCKEDVYYYLNNKGMRNRPLPTLKKLVEICISQNRFDDAIFWCDTAIKYGVTEADDEGYERRKQRIVLLKKRYEIKNNNQGE